MNKKKLPLKNAQPAQGPGASNKYIKRICICGCQREFDALKGAKRQYYSKKCQYHHYKTQVKAGLIPPDGEKICEKCGIVFEYWLLLSGNKEPKLCKSACCCRVDFDKNEKIFDKLEKKINEKAYFKVYTSFAYTFYHALLVRHFYCNKNDGKQCKNYARCLPSSNNDNEIFKPFFLTKGKCYEG